MKHVSADIFVALSLLKPYDISVSKVRVGRERDGGYIMADLPSRGDVISFGVGPEVSFETQMADMQRRVFMFDHTVEGPPVQNNLFHFNKLGLSGEDDQTSETRSLRRHLESIDDATSQLTLKMDVEGAEWNCFATAPADLLQRFDQIVCEVHWLRNLEDENFRQVVSKALRNLTSLFTLFHVHGNNCGELYICGGFTVADVLELSFVRTDLVARQPSTTVYPESLNRSNHPDAPDLPLFFYPFLPSSVPQQRLSEVIRRIEIEAVIKDAKI